MHRPLLWLVFQLLLAAVMIGQAPIHPQRSLAELINTEDPGWPKVKGWISEAKNGVEVLPCDRQKADSALVEVQVTTRSPMGAIVHESGGILVDHGWIRILGSGSPRMQRSLMHWNQGKSFARRGEAPSFLLIADDAAGGFFALNNGALDTAGLGKVFYFGPDGMIWSSTGLGYSEFLVFCFNGDLDQFYTGLRWEGWQKEVDELHGDEAFHFFPYLFTAEGKDVNKVSRKAVPVEELWEQHQQFLRELGPAK